MVEYCSECVYEKLCLIRRELAETIARTRSYSNADRFAKICEDFKEVENGDD